MAATVLIRTAKQAEHLLKAVGASYTIQLPTGEKFTNVKEEPPQENHDGKLLNSRKEPYKRFAASTGAEWGARSKHAKEHISNMQPGDVATIPLNAFFKNAHDLRSTVSSVACTMWGNDSHRTAIPEDRQSVEILRIK